MLLCPVCGRPLRFGAKTARCPSGHSFDIAREGYVNLLCGTKSGDAMGSAKDKAKLHTLTTETEFLIAACTRR